jgi:hypothetical protein
VKLFPLALLLVCVGCADKTQNVTLKTDEEIEIMSRHEVINAIEDCKAVNLRPVMIYSRLRVNGHKTPVIIDITCAPRSN